MDHALIAKLKSLGAQSVAGSLIIGRDTVAVLRNDQVILTPEGAGYLQRAKAKANAEDVVVKRETPAPTPESVPAVSVSATSDPVAATGLKPPRVARRAKGGPVDPPAEAPDGEVSFERASAELTDPEDLAMLLARPASEAQ